MNFNNDPYNTNYDTYSNEPLRQGELNQPQVNSKAYSTAVIAVVFTVIFPLLGFIFGLSALKEYKITGEQKGKGLALAATILSGLEVFCVIAIFALVAILSATLPEATDQTQEDYRCAYAVCKSDCIGQNCPCEYTDADGYTYTIYCE